MKALFFALASLFTFTAMAASAPANLRLGTYNGHDANGNACELDIVPMFGYNDMNSFNLMTVNNYYFQIITGNPAPTSPGHIHGKQDLMDDGYNSGRPTWTTLIGAPIFATVIGTEYLITFSGHEPTSIQQSQFPVGHRERAYAEKCSELKYSP